MTPTKPGRRRRKRAIDILNKAGLQVRVLQHPGCQGPGRIYPSENGSGCVSPAAAETRRTTCEYRVATDSAAQYDLIQDDGRSRSF